MFRSFAVALTFLALEASAQEVVHPPPGAPDPYVGMKKPGTNASCCSGVDCGEAVMCTKDGHIGFVEYRQCNPLPQDRYVHQPPDAVDRSVLHVCRNKRWIENVYVPEVLCWTGGPAT